MSRIKRKKKIILLKHINLNNYSLLKINKNKSKIYRCKYCHKALIKMEKNKFYIMSGHLRHCIIIKPRKKQKDKNRNEKIKDINKCFNESETKKLNNLSIEINENYIKIKEDINEIEEYNTNNTSKYEIYKLKDSILNFNFLSLQNVFDKNNNLNKFQEDMGLYYINKKKIIGEGAYSTVYLGEDKYQRLNIAILEMDIEKEENYNLEIFILQRLHGRGSFPHLYNTYCDENYYYMVESLMGPNLKLLHKICNKSFDYYTIINIGIDLINNIKIIHESGFIHRDLKPDNLAHGNLCFENIIRKNEIAILDFSNSKIFVNSAGKFRYSNKKTKCMGNKCFSSTKALNDEDIGKLDDIKSIFYILIYFLDGSLPWTKKKLNGEHLSKSEIIEIRKNFEINQICSKFPIEFINLSEKVFKMDEKEEPNYEYILNELRKIRLNEEKKFKEKPVKFCWLRLFQNYINKSSFINPVTKNEIKNLFNKYCIKIKEYLEYINLKIE